ncbi:MAG TPA: phytanoyl-CoA dioxygenase family protein [Stellaceae bacterium]|nr:phytanoyl-CoA dioxygenase family protein [Stellaceae bacterium]
MANIGSPFSPLWIDRDDAGRQAVARLEQGLISEDEYKLVAFFIANGYCIIEDAVDHTLIDEYLAEIQAMFATRPDLWVTEGPDVKRLGEAQVDRALTKVLDTYMVSRRALQMAFAPRLARMLKIIFGEPPAVHQGLHFQIGSTQAIHQDTAYVVIKPALALAAAWVALEDVKPGGGELIYYRGSHRFGDFLYPGNQRHWNTDAHGHEIHNHHLAWLHREASEQGTPLEYFWPKKGSLLIWHADLAHGGAPIVNSGYTRKSIVFHYCPVSARPAYFDSPDAAMHEFQTSPEGTYCSSYYREFSETADLPTPAEPPASEPAPGEITVPEAAVPVESSAAPAKAKSRRARSKQAAAA